MLRRFTHRFRSPRLRGACTAALLCLLVSGWPPPAAAQRKSNRVPYLEQEGRKIYLDRCALCHLPDGRGQGDGFNGFPPLTGMSEWMAMREGQLYAAHAIIYGPYGGVIVGDTFYFGMMPRFAPRFTDEQIVAVIRYIAEELNTPLPHYRPIDTSIVAEARRLPDNIDALHEERNQLPWR